MQTGGTPITLRVRPQLFDCVTRLQRASSPERNECVVNETPPLAGVLSTDESSRCGI